MPHFRVDAVRREPGDEISPGGWGRRVRSWGSLHTLYGREAALESARRRVAPDAPSRWSAGFAFREAEIAIAYHEADQDPNAALYEVRASSEATAFAVDMSAIGQFPAVSDRLGIELWAERYWTEVDPATCPTAELLVAESLTVVRRL